MRNVRDSLSEIFQFLVVKCFIYLNRRVFAKHLKMLVSLASHRVPYEDSDQTTWTSMQSCRKCCVPAYYIGSIR